MPPKKTKSTTAHSHRQKDLVKTGIHRWYI